MATKKQVELFAEKIGVSISDDGFSVYADCPVGFCWANDPGLHMSRGYYRDAAFTKPECWQHLMDDMSGGIEKCDCQDCLAKG